MRKLLILLLLCPSALAQVNLNSTIPAPQVKGIVQPINGGFGVDSSGLTGCPKVTAGVWTINTGNCATTPVTLQSIIVSPSTATINIGATQQYTAVGHYSDGSTASLTGTATWTTNNSGVATIASGGLATGTGPGSATVQASSVGVNGTASITVSPAFTITSFNGEGQVYELGYARVNPTFTASYSTTATSANITNTDGVASPTTLTTPFTSATVTGSFTHSSIATTTWTLNASNGSASPTASVSSTWQPAIFSGLGATGAATGATASGTSAILVGDTGTLPRFQLGAESVGTTFGPFSPSGQVVYLLLVGGSHTFVDVCTGFPFFFNTPISVGFVNVNGVTVPEYLYASNVLTYSGSGCAFTPRTAT